KTFHAFHSSLASACASANRSCVRDPLWSTRYVAGVSVLSIERGKRSGRSPNPYPPGDSLIRFDHGKPCSHAADVQVELPAYLALARRIAPGHAQFGFDERDRVLAARLDVALRRRPRTQVGEKMVDAPVHDHRKRRRG